MRIGGGRMVTCTRDFIALYRFSEMGLSKFVVACFHPERSEFYTRNSFRPGN